MSTVKQIEKSDGKYLKTSTEGQKSINPEMNRKTELDKRGYWVRSARVDSICMWPHTKCMAFLRLPESKQRRLIGCDNVTKAKKAVSDRIETVRHEPDVLDVGQLLADAFPSRGHLAAIKSDDQQEPSSEESDYHVSEDDCVEIGSDDDSDSEWLPEDHTNENADQVSPKDEDEWITLLGEAFRDGTFQTAHTTLSQ
jgi:hypothetical protein